MKLSSKLILGYLFVALIACSTAYFAHRSYNNINDAFARLMDDTVPTIKSLNELKYRANQLVILTGELTIVRNEAGNSDGVDRNLMLAQAEQQFAASIKEYNESLKNYEDIIKTQGEFEHKALEKTENTGSNLIETGSQIIAIKKNSFSDKELSAKKAEFETRKTLYFQAVDEALAHEFWQLTDERNTVRLSITKSTYITLGVTFLALTLAVSFGIYISRSIASRIAKLKTASENVGHGELETSLRVEVNDELGDLAHSFNKMVVDLQNSRTELISTKDFVNNIVTSIADCLIVLDMDLNIIRINQAVINLTGFNSDELIGRSIKMLRPAGGFFSEQDMEELEVKKSVSGIETFWETSDSREVFILLSVSIMYDLAGTATGIVCIAQDITVQKSLENQLTHQALHDPLTKLANRVLFRDRVEHAITRLERSHKLIAVLFLDLDNFKTVNDTLGHEAGDILLISVADRLAACLRQSDTVARLGGDEFAILIENTSQIEEIMMLAERLNDVLRSSFLINGKEVIVRTSIGVAIGTSRNERTEDLLRNADLAMYKAKSQGKNRHVFFEDKMHEDLIERVEFEAELRQAVERREFVLHYQPIVNLQSEQIIGMEALVRWNHPRHGLMAPDKFIPAAEDTGLIIPLGHWVLEEACLQARGWQTQHETSFSQLPQDCRHNLSITVNLSNKQVQEENLVQRIVSILAKTKLPPPNLILEITENTMLHNTEATIKKLTELKNLGVKLAIDDFGTGYSSLSYLQRFPIDILKIDKSFVDKINQGREGAAVARAIITMSETLHLKTIAEGIETSGQNTTLQDLGCEFGQGFHFARPLTKDAMDEFLSNPPLIKEAGSQDQTQSENITNQLG